MPPLPTSEPVAPVAADSAGGHCELERHGQRQQSSFSYAPLLPTPTPTTTPTDPEPDLPHLHPHSQPQPRPSSAQQPQTTQHQPLRLRPLRQPVSAACEACRARKTKCNAERPVCLACVRRSSTCRYVTTSPGETRPQANKRKYDSLQVRTSVYEELFQILQTRPQHESQEILRRIRACEDAESIVKSVRDGDLLLQMQLVPESRFRYEFPLVKTMPSFLLIPENPYVDSLAYEWTLGASSPSSSPTPQSESTTRLPKQEESRYTKPFHVAVLEEPLLGSVKPSQWTSVSTDDELMRDILSTYFLREHMWFTYINKTFFLQDMASGVSDFCSELLVNAILAFACHCSRRIPRRADYWRPTTLSYQFLAEAKRLWDREKDRSTITALQAALFLNGICNLDGVDTLGWQYANRAVTMARELHLFEPSYPPLDDRHCVARELTAWTLFCWQSLVSYVMFRPPLLQTPPPFPLPDPDLRPEWYGELWIRYPSDRNILSAQHAHDFKARAELVVIIAAIATEYFGVHRDSDHRPLSRILNFHSRLKTWYDTLPLPLTEKRIILPSHLKLHMKYHTILINLYKPLLGRKLSASEASEFVAEVGQAPRDAISSATIRLETLFRIYYTRHGFDAMDAYILHFLNTLGFMAMEDLKAATVEPALVSHKRSLVLLCALGLREQGQYYYLVRTIYHLFRNTMSQEDASLLRTYAQEQSSEKDELYRPQDLASEYPLNMVNISDDPQMHRVTYLVQEMKDFSLDA